MAEDEGFRFLFVSAGTDAADAGFETVEFFEGDRELIYLLHWEELVGGREG